MQNLAQFKQQLKPYKAIIGFDYGSKRLGIAVSDLLLTVATPYAIWQRSDFAKDLAYIQKVIAEKEVGAIVFGLPLQMNGEEGDIAKEVRSFADKLAEHIDLPMFFWDERLSSSAMENFLIKEVDMSRAKRKKILDASAASYILQGVLDALQHLG
jgi:putative Holliday junction resolvase